MKNSTTYIGRNKTRYERPHRGSARVKSHLWELAEVSGVDSENRNITCRYLNMSGGDFTVPLWASSGNYSLPRAGDIIMIAIDRHDRPHVVGCRDYNVPTLRRNGDIPPVVAGEMCLYSKQTGQRLHFRENGDIQLLTERNEGVEIKPGARVKLHAPALLEVLGGIGRLAYGDVRRRKLGALPLTPTPDDVIPDLQAGGLPHREFSVEIKGRVDLGPATRNGLAARFAIATGIIDSKGEEENLRFGGRLRAILEVSNAVGLSLASLKFDDLGNVELFSQLMLKIRSQLAEIQTTDLTVKSPSIQLGRVGRDFVILGRLFLLFYNTHTHTTPLGPSGPPQPIAPEPAVLSRTVRVM